MKDAATHPVSFEQIDPLHPDALRMIDESEAEQGAIYSPEVRYAFSPQQLVDADVRFLLARCDGAPVGCGGYAVLPGYAELKRMFTTRAARGRRIAAELLRRLENAALDEGLTLMRLETGQDSPEALTLYTRCGYVRCPPFGAYEENGSSVFMEKRLDRG